MSWGDGAWATRAWGDGAPVSTNFGVVSYTIVAVAPGSYSRTPVSQPYMTVTPTSSDSSAMTVQWEWDDDVNFANANGHKQTASSGSAASGVNLTIQTPSALTALTTFYWRARSGDGASSWSSWLSGQVIVYDTSAGQATFYSYQNIGFVITNNREAQLYAYENIGFSLANNNEAQLYAYENVGFNLSNNKEGQMYAYEDVTVASQSSNQKLPPTFN